MRNKLTTFIMLFFTVFYSTYGLDSYESHSRCSEPSGFHVAADDAGEIALITQKDIENDSVGHACHIGHCGFTLRGLSEVLNPRRVLLSHPSEIDQFVASDYRTETLRPPSII